MAKEINILLTSVGRRDYLVQWFRQALEGRGRVFASNNSETPAFHNADGSLITPDIRDEKYLPMLLRFCREQHITAVISLFDQDIPVLSSAAARFAAAGTRVIAADCDVLTVCNDKMATCEMLRRHHLPTPRTYTVQTLRSAWQQTIGENSSLPFPMIVKPRYGCGSIGVFDAHDGASLADAIARCGRKIRETYLSGASQGSVLQSNAQWGWEPPILIQEKIAGSEYNLDIISDLDNHYRNTIVKHKLAMRAGETDVAEIMDPESEEGHLLTGLGEELAQILPHPADLDADVMVSAEGVPCVIDLNARFGGGYPFAHLAGADLPRAIVLWLAGEEVPDNLLRSAPGIRAMKVPMPERM
jgi:carbamoyl-phosphate synthase large subunit